MKKSICKKCGFEEDYEPCEFGLTLQQAEGTCPNCGEPLIDESGSPTKQIVIISLTEKTEQQ